MSDYRWSLGVVIGLPVAGALALVCLGFVVWMTLLWWGERHDRGAYSEAGLFLGMAALGFVGLLLVLGTTAFSMWPFKAEYHQWRTTSGVVESVDSRLLADGNGGTTQRFVVIFDDGRLRSCDDTRCVQVHEGDELTLACKRAWQWSGTHGYDCNYVSHRPVR